MHIAEGILPLNQALAYAAIATPMVLYSAYKIKKFRNLESPTEERAFVSVGTALCFALTVLPIPIPVIGVTSHMCATPLLALIRGPTLMVLPVTLVLLIQALFFAHGGLTTLGVNTFTLGLVGPFLTYGLARLVLTLNHKSLVSIFFIVGLACGLGDLIIYFTDALVLGQGLGGGSFSLSIFKAALLGFLPIQLPLACLEGFLSAYIIKILYSRRPDFLPNYLKLKSEESPLGTQLMLHTKRFSLLLIIIISLMFSQNSFAQNTFHGLDDSLFSQLATQSGHPPWHPFLDIASLLGPEVWQCLISLSYLFAGFILGRFWTRFLEKNKNACR